MDPRQIKQVLVTVPLSMPQTMPAQRRSKGLCGCFGSNEPPEITYHVVENGGIINLQPHPLTPTQPMPDEEELNAKFAELVLLFPREEEEIMARAKLLDNLKTALRTQPNRHLDIFEMVRNEDEKEMARKFECLEMEKQQRTQVENLAKAGCLSDDAKAGIRPASSIVPCPPPPPPPPHALPPNPPPAPPGPPPPPPLRIGSLTDKPVKSFMKNIPQPSNPLKSFNCKSVYGRIQILFYIIIHYEQRIRTLFYKKKFQERVSDAKPKIEAVLEASKELHRSKRLKRLLELILAFGNYMNRGARGNASGFHLSSLNRIVDTKSSINRNLTLLHYIIDTLEKKYEQVVKHFGEDPSHMQPDEFFAIFDTFLTSFNEARQDNETFRRKREDDEKRAKQDTERKSHVDRSSKENGLKGSSGVRNGSINGLRAVKAGSEKGEFDDLISALRTGDVFGEDFTKSRRNRRKGSQTLLLHQSSSQSNDNVQWRSIPRESSRDRVITQKLKV
ncbi:Disheveled-associated activator of like protein [Argiope bruennichi]|uniref:Disheveled-associated activator of like protein n=1 Tax=Argiope bruennichi TaxID=94029 RepID=A0A8T0FPT1_ARGBR|nr:Disheveled-associated activator of like protein [Argiope bruennichi]